MSYAVKAMPIENSADEELLVFAKDGNEKATAELIERMLPLVRSYAFGYKNSFMEQEDLVQEGLLGLLDAVRGFDCERGVSFGAYASSCIKNRMLSAVRASLGQKNRPLNYYVCFDEKKLADSLCIEDRLLNVEEVCRINDAINNKLSAFEKSVIKCHLSGYSYNEIAQGLGSDEKAVDNAIQRARRKLRRCD